MIKPTGYVVDDDDVFRRSLVLLLETAGWRVRDFTSVAEFVAAIDRLDPGVLVLDIRMPRVGGLDLLESPQVSLVNFAVVMVSGHGDVDSVVRSLKAGAVNFIEKPFSGESLLQALGCAYKQLIGRHELSRRKLEAQEKTALLSAREREVLTGLISGASYKVIAGRLCISNRTVEMYRNNIVRKLNVRTTAEAMQIAMLASLELAETEASA